MGSNVRAWVQHRLATDPGLLPVVAGRVMQQGAIISAQATKPYLVHHFGNATDERMADEDNFRPNRQFVQIYIHVPQGDYGAVDDLAVLVKTALLSKAGAPPELVAVQYLESSQDLQDDILQTYFRYLRYQLILSR